MASQIAFLICTEAGDLANKSLLLAESIRCFGGSLKNNPIYSFQPRQGDEIESKILDRLKELGVIHKKIILNTRYPYYPIANKILVSAYGEQNIDADILVFLDSDQVFFLEPSELLLTPDFDVAFRPVDSKHLGSTGENDKNEEYWQKLYNLLAVNREVWVETTVEKDKIRGYWNSGMVAVRRERGIFRTWLSNFETAMEKKLLPEAGIFHLDQLTLAATIASMNVNFLTLSSNYNYPLHKQSQLRSPDSIQSFDEVVSIHYHWMFKGEDWRGALESLAGFDRDSERYRWLWNYLSQRSLKNKIHGF